MTITVEDGTVQVSPPANSYVTVAEFQAFHVARNEEVLADADTEQIEAALIKATDYMQQRLRMLWKGSRVDAFQPLEWPRRGVDVPDFFDPFFRNVNVPVSFQDTQFIPENVIPVEVKNSQIFFASATFDSVGVSNVVLQASLGRTTRSEQVGSLKVEYFGAEGAADGGRITTFYYDGMHVVDPYILAAAPHTGRVVRS